MRGLLPVCLVSVGLALLHGSAHAQALDALRVERAPGAEDCADAANLGERIARIRGRADTPKNNHYEVTFSRDADTFSASIRSGPNGEGQRVLTGRGPTCASLAQATAVTLALLFDSDEDSATKAEPEPKPPVPVATPPVSAPRVEAPLQAAPRPREPLRGTLSLGAAGLVAVLRPISPALVAEMGLSFGGFRAGLGALWVPTQSLVLEPGHVDESLLAGTARACLSFARARRVEFDVCSGLFVGAVNARAAGFTSNEQAKRGWLAVPLELSVADLSGTLGWELSAIALGQLVHHDFEVEGLGAPYHAPRVGAMFTLRAVGLLGQ
ncbi:MAG TPA: hypothetical protein VER96_11900 [Polyangiaceae bacterium]|nr:hypothetical protein [Polyangiaceae bacterium]